MKYTAEYINSGISGKLEGGRYKSVRRTTPNQNSFEITSKMRDSPERENEAYKLTTITHRRDQLTITD